MSQMSKRSWTSLPKQGLLARVHYEKSKTEILRSYNLCALFIVFYLRRLRVFFLYFFLFSASLLTSWYFLVYCRLIADYQCVVVLGLLIVSLKFFLPTTAKHFNHLHLSKRIPPMPVYVSQRCLWDSDSPVSFSLKRVHLLLVFQHSSMAPLFKCVSSFT